MKAVKKPILLQFEIAEVDQVVETKEGPTTVNAGDYIMTGTQGERWGIRKAVFEDTYIVASEDRAFKKNIEVEVEQKSEPFSVTVSWREEPLFGQPGDYLVTYGPDDFGVVAKDIFDETYTVVSE